MSLRNAFAGRRLVVPPLPEPSVTIRLARHLSATGMGVMSAPTVDLDAVADRFVFLIGRGEAPRISDWNKIAWCLWTTRPAIAEHDSAFEAVLGRVARMQRKRPYRQLASAYLADFAPERPRLNHVAAVLAGYAPVAGDPWSGLQAKYGLFDGMEAILRLARIALNEGATIQGILEGAGLGSALLESGFAEAVHDEVLKTLRTKPVTSAADRLGLIRQWCFRANETMIFQNSKAGMARAIVLPFGDRLPAREDRDLILGFLVTRFGDPRVHSGAWIGIDDVADVLKRWLTEQSLRQFFDVVDKVAPPSQWRYRRAFWQAFHKAGLIRNAWVVFGPDGAAEAKRSFGRDIRFGVFRSGGRKQVGRGHAVLLMDLGQCIVADWSHDGYCNIWPISDATRPRNLNAESYTSSEVRRPVPDDQTESNVNRLDMFRHVSSANYIWQDRVARRLYALIGVRVPQSDYRVH